MKLNLLKRHKICLAKPNTRRAIGARDDVASSKQSVRGPRPCPTKPPAKSGYSGLKAIWAPRDRLLSRPWVRYWGSLTLPNMLTILRIALIPFIINTIINGSFNYAFWLFLIACLTDGLDGYLARLLNQQTDIGSYLDPIADKLLILSCYFCFSFWGSGIYSLPKWFFIFMLVKEAILIFGSIYIVYKDVGIFIATITHRFFGKFNLNAKIGISVDQILRSQLSLPDSYQVGLLKIKPGIFGKLAMLAQTCFILFLLSAHDRPPCVPLFYFFIGFIIILNICAFLQYIFQYLRDLNIAR